MSLVGSSGQVDVASDCPGGNPRHGASQAVCCGSELPDLRRVAYDLERVWRLVASTDQGLFVNTDGLGLRVNPVPSIAEVEGPFGHAGGD